MLQVVFDRTLMRFPLPTVPFRPRSQLRSRSWGLSGSDYKDPDYILLQFSQLTITVGFKIWLKILPSSDPSSKRITLGVVILKSSACARVVPCFELRYLV